MNGSERGITNLLQRLYRHGTTFTAESGLMRRCERTLAPLRPHLPPWNAAQGAKLNRLNELNKLIEDDGLKKQEGSLAWRERILNRGGA